MKKYIFSNIVKTVTIKVKMLVVVRIQQFLKFQVNFVTLRRVRPCSYLMSALLGLVLFICCKFLPAYFLLTSNLVHARKVYILSKQCPIRYCIKAYLHTCGTIQFQEGRHTLNPGNSIRTNAEKYLGILEVIQDLRGCE